MDDIAISRYKKEFEKVFKYNTSREKKERLAVKNIKEELNEKKNKVQAHLAKVETITERFRKENYRLEKITPDLTDFTDS